MWGCGEEASANAGCWGGAHYNYFEEHNGGPRFQEYGMDSARKASINNGMTSVPPETVGSSARLLSECLYLTFFVGLDITVEES